MRSVTASAPRPTRSRAAHSTSRHDQLHQVTVRPSRAGAHGGRCPCASCCPRKPSGPGAASSASCLFVQDAAGSRQFAQQFVNLLRCLLHKKGLPFLARLRLATPVTLGSSGTPSTFRDSLKERPKPHVPELGSALSDGLPKQQGEELEC